MDRIKAVIVKNKYKVKQVKIKKRAMLIQTQNCNVEYV